MIKKLLPWISGLCVLLYLYSWTQDISYPAYVPLVWCFGCWVNDLYEYLENRDVL